MVNGLSCLIRFILRMTSENADSLLNAFLTYLGQRQASWTAWDFLPHNLIEDTTDFKPTSFATGAPWVCGSPSAAQAGMGIDVQNYLSNIALTAPPSISITSPVDGSKVQTERNVTITASVTGDVGVTKVAFFVNGTLLCTDTTAPYTCRWHTPRKGNATYTIQARAYDSAGNKYTSTIRVKSSSNRNLSKKS